MANNKLVVIFPGRNYSCDKPVLYYAAKIFSTREYDVIPLSYNIDAQIDRNDVKALVEGAKQSVLRQRADVDFQAYEDVVFVSKSMGTVLAGFFEYYFKINVRHIYLTPVADALKYMQRGKCIVVSGKDDKILEARKLKIYCVEQDIALKQFEEVGHSLEHPTDINKTFAILMVLVRLFKEF